MPRGVASGARYKQRLEPNLLHAKALLPNATPLTHPHTVHVRKLATTTEATLHTALKRHQHLPTHHRCCGDRAAFTTDSANSNRLQPHHKAACNNLRHAGPCEGHYATTVHAGLPNHYQKGDDPRPTAFGRTGTCAHMRPSSPKNGPDRHMQPFFHACWNGPRCAARHRHSHTRPVPSPRLATYLAERQTSTTIDAGPLRRLRKKTQNQCGQR